MLKSSVLLLAGFEAASTLQSQSLGAGNPIKKVLTILGKMQDKIDAEGEKEGELFKKYECFCKGGKANADKEIDEARARIEALKADIVDLGGSTSGAGDDIEQKKADREEAQQSLQTLTAMRQKENEAFELATGEDRASIDAMRRAIAILEGGGSSSKLLQAASSTDFARLRKAALFTTGLTHYEKDTLTSFLTSKQGYSEAGTGEVVGILKQTLETLEKTVEDDVDREASQAKAYEEERDAKNQMISSLTDGIEKMQRRMGDSAVALAEAKGELTNTQNSLADNQAMVAHLEESCSDKSSEWEERQQIRNEELTAINEAKAMLNDDSARELLRSTVDNSGKSFIQTETRSPAITAASYLRSKDPRIALIAYAVKNSSGAVHKFEKVIKMIDDLQSVLKSEQKHDDDHLEFCANEHHSVELQVQSLTGDIHGLKATSEDLHERSNVVSGDIETIHQNMKLLKEQVEEAGEQRAAEHDLFLKTTSENTQAMQLINKVITRLQKFYQPTVAAANSETEQVQEQLSNLLIQRHDNNKHGLRVGLSLLQVQVHAVSDAPNLAGPPGTWDGDYTKKEGGNGVLNILQTLVHDMELQATVDAKDEEHAKQEYETLIADAQAKQTVDKEGLSQLEMVHADLDAKRYNIEGEHSAKQKELYETHEYAAELKGQCSFLQENYDFRKEMRVQEAESLQSAKHALQGGKVA